MRIKIVGHFKAIHCQGANTFKHIYKILKTTLPPNYCYTLLGVCSPCTKVISCSIRTEGLDSSLGKPDNGWTEASLPNVLDNEGMAIVPIKNSLLIILSLSPPIFFINAPICLKLSPILLKYSPKSLKFCPIF